METPARPGAPRWGARPCERCIRFVDPLPPEAEEAKQNREEAAQGFHQEAHQDRLEEELEQQDHRRVAVSGSAHCSGAPYGVPGERVSTAFQPPAGDASAF